MMMRQERAKQFMPFDALKGLQEALRDREERHTRVERHEISEEMQEQNSTVIAKIDKRIQVSLDYYCAFHHITKDGIVTEVDRVFKFLKLNGEKIYFEDIYKIRILDRPPAGVFGRSDSSEAL